MGMSIKSIGQKVWAIDAVIKRHGKQFRHELKKFRGTESQAQREYTRLYEWCRKDAEEWVKGDLPLKTFGQLIDAYFAANAVSPNVVTIYNRLRRDCGNYPLAKDELRPRFFGGMYSDKPGGESRLIRGYIQILDTTYRRTGTGKIIPFGSNEEKSKEIPKRLAASTKNKLVWAAGAVTRWGYNNDLIPTDPLKGAKRWHTEPRNRTLRDDEYKALFGAFQRLHPEYLPIFLYSLKNPARIGDLRALRRDSLDLVNNRIRYVSSKRKVPVIHLIHDDLKEYFRSLPPECPWLFYRPSEQAYEQIGDFRRAWKRIKQDAKIGDLRWHDLRHHALTWLIENGVSIQGAMAIGGWKTLQMIEVYHNVRHERAADMAAAALYPQVRPGGETPSQLIDSQR